MILQHLKERHFNLPLYAHTWVDIGSNQVTFPLFSFSGELVGYQKYNPLGFKLERRNPKEGKYYTIRNELGVWGLEYQSKSHPDLLFIVEGVFKACRLHNLGYNAIAVLSNNPTHLKQQLSLLSLSKRLVVIPDPDKAGMELVKYADEYLLLDKPLDECEDNYIKEKLLCYLPN